ncbi:hypothetical protein [Streptomyces hydrogenans]|uniref:hypothetical protein n=1 Tax=Streptomyces hydrogenans TaxID=1873719 RepID=UPI00341B2DFC
MTLTTVTLPGGTAAVVHTLGVAWTGAITRGPSLRDDLIKDVLHDVYVEGMRMGCDALRRARTAAADITVEDMPHDMIYAQMQVLCTNPECRTLAEHGEQVGEPFLDAPAARAWALTQPAPANDTKESS